MKALALLALVALAGCLSSPPAPSPTPVASSPPASSANLTLVPIYTLDRNDTAATRVVEETFAVPRAHWLCIDWDLARQAGAANLTLLAPQGASFQLYDTASHPNLTGEDMVGGIEGNWTVRLALSGWTGRTTLSVENEV